MSQPLSEQLRQAARMIFEAKWPIALTGAGISVDSGIPDFRSPGGLWTRFDPMEYASIQAFRQNPVKVWKMLKELSEIVSRAKPNPAHTGLAQLEKMGFLRAVITQNVDNLHQEAGSCEVIEFHGNGNELVCPTCGGRMSAAQTEERFGKTGEFPPECPACAEILKPAVIFFGEPIPYEALEKSQMHAYKSDLILVLGTSATVAPASHIPVIVKQNNGRVLEFNLMETQLSPMADMTLLGSTSVTVPDLVDALKELI